MAKPTDTPNERAARGQAYNLAILTAIADCKQHDNAYVLKQYFRHKEFASMLQNCDEDALVLAIDNPKLIEALNAIKVHLL